MPSSSKVQLGVPRQGGRKGPEGGAWVAQVGSFLSPSPLLHGLASSSALAYTFPGSAPSRKESLAAVWLELALGALWVLLSQTCILVKRTLT